MKKDSLYSIWNIIQDIHGNMCLDVNSYSHTTSYKCCGYVSAFDVPHSYGNYLNDGIKHWQECTTCKYITNQASHNYIATGVGDFDSHWLDCTTCSYGKTCTATPTLITTTPSIHILTCHGYQATRTHEFTGSEGTFDEHYAKCTVQGCNYVSPTLCNNTPTVISKTSLRHTLSCHGKTKSEDHSFTVGSGTLYDHYPKCSNIECSYVKTTKCNEIVPIVSYNSSTHTYRCHGISLSEPHDKYTSGGIQYCSVDGCNWSQSTHTHFYGAPYIPAGSTGGMSRHYATCSCGSQKLLPCMGFAPDPGQTAFCELCGQEMIGGFVLTMLPNDIEFFVDDEDIIEYSDFKSFNEMSYALYDKKTYIVLPKEQEYHFLE